MAFLWERPADTTDRGYDVAEGWPLPDAGAVHPHYDEESEGASLRAGRRVEHTHGVEYRLGSEPVATHAERRQIEGGRMDILRRMIFAAHRDHSRLIYLAIGAKFEDSQINADSPASFNFTDAALYPALTNGTSVIIQYEPGGAGDPRALAISRSGRSLPMSIAPGMIARSGVMSAQVVDAVFLSTNRVRLLLSRPLKRATDFGVALVYENEVPGYAAPRLELPAEVLDEGPPYPCVNDVDVWHHIFESFAATHPGSFVSKGIAPGRYCSKINAAGVDPSQFGLGDYCRNEACPYYEAHTPATPQAGDYSRLFGSRGPYIRQLLPGFADIWNQRLGREGPSGFLMLLGFKLGFFVQELNIFTGFREHTDRGIARWRTGDVDPATGYDIYRNFEEYQTALVTAGQIERDDVGLVGWMSQFSQVSDSERLGREIPADGEDDPGHPQATFQRAIGLTRLQGTGYADNEGLSGRGVFDVQRPRPRLYTSPVFTPGEPGTHDNGETRLRVFGEMQTLETGGGDFEHDLVWELPRFGRTIGDERPPRARVKVSGQRIYRIAMSGSHAYIHFELGDFVGAVPSGVTLEPGIPDIKRRTFKSGGNVVSVPYAAWTIWNPYSLQRLGDPRAKLMPGDVLHFRTGELAGVKLLCVEARACVGPRDDSALLDPGLEQSIPPTMRANRTRRDFGRFRVFPGDDARVRNMDGYEGSWVIESSAVLAAAPVLEHYMRDPATGQETATAVPASQVRVHEAAGVIRVRTEDWAPELVHRLHARVVAFDEEERHSLENGRALMRWPVEMAKKAFWPFTIGGGTPKAAAYWVDYLQPDGSPNSEAGLISMVQIPDNPLDPVNVPFPKVWTSPNLQTEEERNGSVIVDEGMRVVGDPEAGDFGHALTDAGDERGFWTLQLDAPLLAISANANIGRLAPEDVDEARIDLRLGSAEAKRVTWGHAGTPINIELLDSFPVRPTVLAGPDDQHLSLRGDLTPAIGSLTRFDQGGGESKYQGTIDFTAAVRWLLANGDDIHAGDLVVYLALMFTDVESVTDVKSFANSLLEASAWNGVYSPEHYVGVTRQLLYESISLTNLQIRFTEAAVKTGALYHYNESGQVVTPDLTWFPGKGV